MALRDQPYLPLYVNDFISDEKLRNCSAESVGIYIWLMCILHKQPVYGALTLQKKFQTSDNQVLNFAFVLLRQMPFTLEEIERGLSDLIECGVVEIQNDMLIQKRMIKDGKLSEIRANAGRKGGKSSKNGQNGLSENSKKSEQNESKTTSKTKANSEIEIEYVNETETVNRLDTKKGTKSSNVSSTVEEQFAVFWSAYPKKKNKEDAKAAFKTVLKDKKTTLEVMLSAVETQKESHDWQKENGQYIPYPATWLRRGAWDNKEYVPKAKTDNIFLDLAGRDDW